MQRIASNRHTVATTYAQKWAEYNSPAPLAPKAITAPKIIPQLADIE
jgi:hypothetical protein